MCRCCLDKEKELLVLRRKIWIVEEVSRIKRELLALDKLASFRSTVANPRYKNQLEEIFGVPFICIKDRYLSLLGDRNRICHTYLPFRHDSAMPRYF
jgi:hypothetical protein